jgi:hypothetical protein
MYIILPFFRNDGKIRAIVLYKKLKAIFYSSITSTRINELRLFS